MRIRICLTTLVACAALSCGSVVAQTLKAVNERGTVNCGVSQGVIGFSIQGSGGRWTGFDVDFCRALAAAIFNDAGKVTFVPLSAEERFGALQSRQIDVLSRNSTWTMGREAALQLAFAGVTFYDGQALMVRYGGKAGPPPSSICATISRSTPWPTSRLRRARLARRAPPTRPGVATC
jgi:general L-amino acid transport system substrate-binding protein